jgi:hypothetical protein
MSSIQFWGMLAVAGIGILVAFAFLSRTRSIRGLDVALLIAPLMLWYVLMEIGSITGLHPKSLSNLIEPFVLIPILAVCLLVRTFAFRALSNERRSALAFRVGLAASFLIWALVPGLPE